MLAATATVAGAPGALLAGRLANRVRLRRPLVVGTLLVVALVLAAIPALSGVTAVIVANAVLWLVVASVAPVLTMLVIDSVPEHRWSERIGRLNTYQGYGWAGGLVLGTVWPLVGTSLLDAAAVTRSLFWVFAGCGAVSVLGAAASLPQPDPGSDVTNERQARRVARILANTRQGIRGATFVFTPNRLYWSTRRLNPRRLLRRRNPALGRYFLAATLLFVGSAAFYAPLPLFLTGTGFTTGGVFALYLAASLASAVLYGPVGTAATRRDVYRLQAGALGVRGAAIPVVALVAGLGATVQVGVAGVALVAIGASWAVIAVVGTAIVTRLAPATVRGDVLGAYTAVSALAGGAGGLLGGWLATFGYLVAFGIAGVLVLLGAALVYSLQLGADSETLPGAHQSVGTSEPSRAEHEGRAVGVGEREEGPNGPR